MLQTDCNTLDCLLQESGMHHFVHSLTTRADQCTQTVFRHDSYVLEMTIIAGKSRTGSLADLHVNGAPTRHNTCIFHGSAHNHDGVMQGPLSLINELL